MLLEYYYESDNAPHEALGRAARRLSGGGALYLGAGVGIERVKKGDAETFHVTQAPPAKPESFPGPLSAVVRAFTIAGGSTEPDSPGGVVPVSSPAAAARLRELIDIEADRKRDIERFERRMASRVKRAWSPGVVDDEQWELRRLAELRAELAQVEAERRKLLASGKVEEVEQTRPGTNFTKIPAKNVAKLKGIVEHYAKAAKPFTECVADQVKHGLSEDHANRRCAVVKDLGRGTTKWRKGAGKASEEAQALLEAALGRLGVVEREFGAVALMQLAEGGSESPVALVRTLAESVMDDFALLALAGHPVAEALWSPHDHPRAPDGEFARKLGSKAAVTRTLARPAQVTTPQVHSATLKWSAMLGGHEEVIGPFSSSSELTSAIRSAGSSLPGEHQPSVRRHVREMTPAEAQVHADRTGRSNALASPRSGGGISGRSGAQVPRAPESPRGRPALRAKT